MLSGDAGTLPMLLLARPGPGLAAQGPWRVPCGAAFAAAVAAWLCLVRCSSQRGREGPRHCRSLLANLQEAVKSFDTRRRCRKGMGATSLNRKRDDLHEYTSRSKRIKYDILRAMAKLLELDEHCLVNQFSDRALTYARFKYYPSCPSFSEMERGTMFQLCLTTPC